MVIIASVVKIGRAVYASVNIHICLCVYINKSFPLLFTRSAATIVSNLTICLPCYDITRSVVDATCAMQEHRFSSTYVPTYQPLFFSLTAV